MVGDIVYWRSKNQRVSFGFSRERTFLFLDYGAGWLFSCRWKDRSFYEHPAHIGITWQNPHHWILILRNPHGVWRMDIGSSEANE